MKEIKLNNEQIALVISTILEKSRMKCLKSNFNCKECKLRPEKAEKCLNDLADYEFVLDTLEWLEIEELKLIK